MPHSRRLESDRRLSLERLEQRAMLAGNTVDLIVQFDQNPEVGIVGPIAAEEVAFNGLSSEVRGAMDSMGIRLEKTLLDGRLSFLSLESEVDPNAALALLRTLPQVQFAVFDDTVELAEFIPNDTEFDAQWPLDNAQDTDIDATFAWDQTTGSATTVVAVMDTGIDYTHPDLYLAIALNNAEIPSALLGQLVDTNSDGQIDFYDLNSLDAWGNVVLDGSGAKFNAALVTDQNGNAYIDAGDLLVPAWSDGIDTDGNGWIDDLTGWDSETNSNDAMDSHGHGTHVSGIIAARGNNGMGIAGVNWNARILPEQFHNGSGGTISDAIEAIEHAVAMGADVINSSWGTFDDNPALRTAVEWAGENDVVFVAAAGNHSNDLDAGNAYYPAAYDLPNLISVASIDPSGALSSFSNYGLNSVDVAAPGANVLSAGIGGGYLLWSGTSMAVPHVAGVVSLLVGLFPGESATWFVDRVLSTTKPLPSLAGKVSTGGTVDAFSAVNTVNVAGPRIVAASPQGDVVDPTDRVSLTFDRPIDASTFTTDDVSISGPAGSIDPTGVNQLSDFQFEVVFPIQSTLGNYSVDVGPEVEDTLGRVMDQDRDGITGEPLDDRFNVAFRLLPAPNFSVVDNGDSGFSATSGWTNYVGVGEQGDFAYKASGSGAETATWTFGNLSAGEYRVSATWQEYTNRATDTAYLIQDGSTALNTVLINQQVAPTGFLENGTWWQDLGTTYNVFSGSLAVQLSDQASGGYITADAVRLERVGDPVTVTGPELVVTLGGSDVPDGGSVDFGSTDLGVPVIRTFTVQNAGSDDLTLGTITLPSGYSLAADFGVTTLAFGETTTFDVQLDASAAGVATGTISFDSNDSDENPFDIAVSGTVTDSSQTTLWVVDNGDSGFSATSGWTNYVGVGEQGDFAYKASGSGAETATWTFGNLSAGEYRVSATWQEYTNRATDTAYLIQDGSTALNTVLINQQVAPTGFLENGTWWQDLGTTYNVFSGSLAVQLSDQASGGYITADAVRLERVGDPVTVTGPELVVTLGGSDVPDGGSVDFGSTDLGVPVIQTFTVQNAGSDDLTLGTITLPSGYSLAADFGVTTLAFGETTTFDVQLDASAAGVATGTISFDSNDSDENPFDIAVSGTVTDSSQTTLWVVDNGDSGFSATSGWTNYVGVGEQGDFAYKASGSGAETATWTFGNLSAGEYRVSATWQEYTNRATDTAYLIQDGSTALNTVLINQQVAPTGFLENGTWWQDLGTTYNVFSGSLAVQLSDQASGGYITADAVRLERVGDPVTVTGPELVVTLGGSDVPDGGSVDFGSTDLGVPVIRTFTVQNAGSDDLTLGTITLPSGYSLAADFGVTTLAFGETTTFDVQLDASAAGVATGTISFDSNDSDENPFDIAVSGTVTDSSQTTLWVVDNGDSGFSATSGWTNYVGVGEQGDFAYKASGSGAETATWTFGNLSAGEYRVSATWQEYTNRATDTAYLIQDGSTALNTVLINQQVAPTGFLENGTWWQDLGTTYNVFSGSLAVQLSDQASGGYITADAVRLERVGDPVTVTGPELVVTLGGSDVPDGGSVDFGSTDLGVPMIRTFTVRNAGSDDLTLGTITLPSGYSLAADFGVTTLAFGETTTFDVQLDASAAGVATGTISFDSNDSDENPFDIAVSGTVTSALLA